MVKKEVLVIGSGGREFTLAQLFSANGRSVHWYPGNAGYLTIPHCCLATPASGSKKDLIAYVRQNGIGLVVIGPEKELVEGYADAFKRAGIPVFGPNRRAAHWTEGSKHSAKKLMTAAKIPTARYRVFTKGQLKQALDYVWDHFHFASSPIVIKADGLCGGKGATVARDLGDAQEAIRDCLERDKHGKSGRKILIEEFLAPAKGLQRAEFSMFVLIGAGNSYLVLPPVMDYKPVFDGDQGPNGGGSGAVSRPYFVTNQVQRQVDNLIIKPLLVEMKRRGIEYRGVLYLGLMLTDQGPMVVEFNCRFGDPELQALLGSHLTGLVSAMEAVANGHSLEGCRIKWSDQYSVYVVLMAKGYPGSVEKGREILGFDLVPRLAEGVFVIHSGTTHNGQRFVINGGRVLGVLAVGRTLKHARKRAYRAMEMIACPETGYRTDIGKCGCEV